MTIRNTARRSRKRDFFICCAPLLPLPGAMVALNTKSMRVVRSGIVVAAASVSVVSLGAVAEEVVVNGVVDLVVVILSVISVCVVRRIESVVCTICDGEEVEALAEFVVVSEAISAGQITPAPGVRQTVVSLPPGH